MKDLSQTFASLEKQARKLIAQQSEQSQAIAGLKNELEEKNRQLDLAKEEAVKLKNENNVLKMASAVQGSDEYRTDAKRQINELVREIDKCISMMSK